MGNPDARRRYRIIQLVLVIALLLVVPASLKAQTRSPGLLTGKVTNPSGAPVVNATVTATNLETNQPRTATSGKDGMYGISNLPPGNYRVRFEATGFQVLEVPSTTVGATAAVVDGKLVPGPVTQQ
jgi:hypothetical protein